MTTKGIEIKLDELKGIDKKLCKLFADCNLREEASETVEITPEIKNHLNGAPESLFFAMMRYIDLSPFRHIPDYDDEEDKAAKTASKTVIQHTLAGLIAERAAASLEYAVAIQAARLNKVPEEFQTMHILDNNQFAVYGLSGSTDKANIARKAFSLAMQVSGVYEDQFIKTHSGPYADMKKHRQLTLAA